MNSLDLFKTKFINLTSHDIQLKLPDGIIIKIKPSGKVARVMTTTIETDKTINGIPCVKRNLLGYVEDLPEPKEGYYYIVSAYVYYMSPDRMDIVAPDTNTLNKGDKRIVTQFVIN